jgi:RHS repeat-associated protein
MRLEKSTFFFDTDYEKEDSRTFFGVNYQSFGSTMPGRNYSSNNYRYGFNGKEKDNEVKGDGNSYDFDARMLDSRLGRWLSIDPKASKYPYFSPYLAFGNNPVYYIDPGGETLRVAQPDQVRFIEDASKVLGEDATNLFSFDECGDVSMTKVGQMKSFANNLLGTNKGDVFGGVIKVLNSDDVTEIHYVASGIASVPNPETGDLITTEKGKTVNTAIDSYGGEMTIEKGQIKSLEIKDMKNNHIFLSKEKIHNKSGDKRENNLFHAIGHILFQKNSEQEKVIDYDNKARRETGDAEKEVDDSHKNGTDPK